MTYDSSTIYRYFCYLFVPCVAHTTQHIISYDLPDNPPTIHRYNIEVTPTELEAALNIEARWRQLYCDSRTRDLRLVDTKNQFRAVTATQDRGFRETLQELRRNFLGLVCCSCCLLAAFHAFTSCLYSFKFHLLEYA